MKITVFFIILAFVLLLGCTVVSRVKEVDVEDDGVGEDEEEIDTTYVNEDLFPPSDEWMTVPMEELPFHAQIPAWWSFAENPAEYILWFDEGNTGSITFAKKVLDVGLSVAAPEGSVVTHNNGGDMTIYCYENSCVVQMESGGDLYGFVISDKGFSVQQNSEVWEIVKRLELD